MMNRKKPISFKGKPGAAPRPTHAPRKVPETPKLAEDAADEAFEGESAAEMPDAPRLVRLNKYLADHGVASRRRCDELIAAGQVTVDGAPVNELGLKIDADKQVIEINGVILKPKDARRRYYVLNKPSGVVCTNEPRETRPRAIDLITDPYKGRVYTVGRLDEESKGLIIVTNDGEFANRIMHPRYGIEKTYVVRVRGRIEDDALTKIREGVHLSEGRTSGARVLVDRRTHDSSQLTVTVHEGMNREIRRVFARVGYKVTDLRRVRIGPLSDQGLKPGRWRELLNREVEALLAGKNQAQDGERANIGHGPPKRFPKKRGYARDFVKGGKLVPGARREREAKPRIGPRLRTAPGDRPRTSFGDGPRNATGARPRNTFGAGPRTGFGAGPRSPRPGARSGGVPFPRAGDARTGRPQTGGFRGAAPRPGASRGPGGPRTGGASSGGARGRGASSGGAGGARPGAARRSSGPRSGPSAPRGGRSDRGGRR